MARSIFEKYGGFGSVNRVVLAFYDNVLDNDALGPYFDDVDMKKLIDHQTKFVSMLLGGPADFSDDHLLHAHAHLDISSEHFDEMKTVMADTLGEAEFDTEDIEAVLEAIEARRAQVARP